MVTGVKSGRFDGSSGGFDLGGRCGAGNETLAFAEIYFPDAEIHGFDVDVLRMRVRVHIPNLMSKHI